VSVVGSEMSGLKTLAVVAFVFAWMAFAEWFATSAPFWLGLLLTVGFFTFLIVSLVKLFKVWGQK